MLEELKGAINEKIKAANAERIGKLFDLVLESSKEDMQKRMEDLKQSLQKQIIMYTERLEEYCLGCNLKKFLAGKQSANSFISVVTDSRNMEICEQEIHTLKSLYATLFGETFEPELKGLHHSK